MFVCRLFEVLFCQPQRHMNENIIFIVIVVPCSSSSPEGEPNMVEAEHSKKDRKHTRSFLAKNG